MRPLGFDLSYWQLRVMFAILFGWKLKPRFFAARATVGRSYRDAWFDRNFRAGAEPGDEPNPFGFYRAPYHLIRPEYSGKDTSEWAFEVAPDPGELGRVWDYEPTSGGLPDWRILEYCVKAGEDHDQRSQIVYSRYLIIQRIPEVAWLDTVWWWLAQYLRWQTLRGEHPGPPTIPANVDVARCILHQTADKLAGPPGAVESRSLDRDRWLLGDPGTLAAWIEQESGQSQPPTLVERIQRLESFHA